jgi:sortase A
MIHRWARRVGWALVALGMLVLLFAAYQLWGTGLGTARDQARLRAQLGAELPGGARAAQSHAGADPAGSNAHRAPAGAVPSARVAPPAPTPVAGQPVATIEIPRIGLDMVVVQGVTAADLAMGPGHYPGTPLPGEAGNVAIAGHRTTYLHPFYGLTAVADGDAIVLTTPQGVFTYLATSQSVVAPTDVAVIAPSGAPTLTLTTCNPRYSAATRLVVHAALVRSVLLGTASPATPGRAGHRASRTDPGAPTKARTAGLAGAPGAPGLAAPIAWGAGVLTVALAAAAGRRRLRRRWPVYLLGGAAGLVVLFFFFGAVAPLMPASF